MMNVSLMNPLNHQCIIVKIHCILLTSLTGDPQSLVFLGQCFESFRWAHGPCESVLLDHGFLMQTLMMMMTHVIIYDDSCFHLKYKPTFYLYNSGSSYKVHVLHQWLVSFNDT